MRFNQTTAFIFANVVVLAHGVNCFCQTVGALHFESAVIKETTDGAPGVFSGGPGRDSGYASYSSVSLANLIRDAYHVTRDQISGPAWLGSVTYSVSVKYSPTMNGDEYRAMLADLLAERFHLSFHRQTTRAPLYELVVADPGGLKLTVSQAQTATQIDQPGSARGQATDARGFPIPPSGMKWSSAIDGDVMRLTFRQSSMGALANALTLIINSGRPYGTDPINIVDHSGVAGSFDFHLELPAPARSNEANPNPSGADIHAFADSLKKQLGITLNATVTNREILVIDHIDRKPTEN